MVRASRLGTEELATTHITHTERNNMSNPYELRFRLLEMAQSYLYDQQERQNNFAIDAWEFAKEQGTADMKVFEDLQPESYSIKDIKKKAAELYEFVETK